MRSHTYRRILAVLIFAAAAASTATAAARAAATVRAGAPALGWPTGGNAEGSGYLAPERFAAALKYSGLTYHPGGGENTEHYKRSLDAHDYWVILVGFQGDADYKLHRFFYARASASLYQDCAELWAGFYHLGFRANWDVTDKLSLRIGIGPTYLWRQNWFGRVKDYEKDSFFGAAKGGDFQGAFIWYGGDADVEWKAWDKLSLVYSVIPGYPEVITSSLGLRYNF